MKLHRQWMAAALATLIATGGSAVIVRSQPEPPNDGGNDQRQGPDFRDMTPEQREAAMEKRREEMLRGNLEMLRGNLTNAGYTDKALQDAIVDYTKAQDKAVQPLRDQARKLIQAIRDKTTPPDQLGTLLNDFRTAADAEKDRRKDASADLDAKIGYTKNPRLEAYLTMLGIIGDEASLIANNGGRMGGLGGGPGGGFGGPGGGGPGGPPPDGDMGGGPPPGGDGPPN